MNRQTTMGFVVADGATAVSSIDARHDRSDLGIKNGTSQRNAHQTI